MKQTKKFWSTKTLVLSALMTALVIVTQTLATLFPNVFGPFAGAVALVPIIIGGCLCGPIVGTLLGIVFSLVVLVTAPSSPFTAMLISYDPFATVTIVMLKGTFCALISSVAYKLLSKLNDIVAAVVAAILCPIINTGIFLFGSITMLWDNLAQITNGEQKGFVATIVFFWGIVIANFIFELILCAVFSPIIVKVLSLRKRMEN